MKRTYCKTFGTIACSLIAINSFSQNWKQGGNGAFPPAWDVSIPANQLLGTTTNFPLKFITNGTQRMTIDNGGTGVTAGRIAMGNNLPVGFAPQARLHLHHTGATGTVNMLFTNTATGIGSNSGLEIGISPLGDAFFINHEFNQNFSWYNRGSGPSTLLGRMRLHDGGIGQSTGRLDLGNDLSGYVPVDRLNLFEAATTGSVQTRYQNSTTGVTAADGYAVGVDNTNGVVNHTQFEKKEIRWLSPDARQVGSPVKEWLRIQNNTTTGNTCGQTETDGYLGLNQIAPIFHIDGITPAKCDGELFIGFTSSDVPNSKMGLCNTAMPNSVLVPTFFGNLDASQFTPALQTLGCIKSAQDVTPIVNPLPVERFIVGKDWTINNVAVADISEVTNRYAFTWQNSNNIKMHMAANGQVRIGNNLSTVASPSRNRLEISADATVDPYGSAIATNGASGVRLSYLTSAKTPLINGTNGVDNTKILSVDSAGVIVLVSPPAAPILPGAQNGTSNVVTAINPTGKTELGNDYGGTAATLLNNREIPMSGFNLLYSNNGRIGLGNAFNAGATAPQAKLDIRPTNTDQLGLVVFNNNTMSSVPLYTMNAMINNAQGTDENTGLSVSTKGTPTKAAIGINTYAGAVGVTNTGIIGFSDTGLQNNGGNFGAAGSASGGNIGVAGSAFESLIGNVGGNFRAGNTSTIPGGYNGITNTGVNVTCLGGVTGYGVYTSAFGATNNYGIYAEAGTPTAPGNPPAGPDYAGYFNGDVVRTGTDNFTSDFNLKQNIDTITNAIGIINQLKPKTFEYKKSSYPSMNLPSGKQYGLIAQDVQTVLPELVNNNVHPAKLDSVGNVITPAVNFLSLEYQQLIGIMIKGMQQQQAQIKKQDSLITVLSNQINSCCSNTTSRTSNSINNQLDIELSDKDAIVLNQNVPNPFAEQTTITYNVPTSVGKAQIIFFNNIGQVIQTVDIKTRGKGKVNVFASDLSSGLYNYTLVADGKVIDSKKMVRE